MRARSNWSACSRAHACLLTRSLAGALTLALLLSPLASTVAADSAVGSGENATGGSVPEGKRLFLAVGCYECHGTTGTGANTGPKIAPNPIPLPAFVYQLRHPIGTPPYGNMKMPPYGGAVLSDAQVADIYAYLKSIKPGLPANRIPLLNR